LIRKTQKEKIITWRNRREPQQTQRRTTQENQRRTVQGTREEKPEKLKNRRERNSESI